MSRRSPRSYISRTFPDAMRGRSRAPEATPEAELWIDGGMRRRLSGLEDDHGDRPVGLALVVRVLRIHLHKPRPERVALLVGRAPRAHTAAVAADLDLGVGRAHQVVEPRRVLVGAALGGDDDEALAVVEV